MALRSGYFENWGGSPTVLLWGDAGGMLKLSEALRNVQRAPDLRTFCQSVDGKPITIKPSSQPVGMIHKDGALEWSLDPALADDYAKLVDVLATSSKGHQYLESRNGVAVTVSIGEYPDSLHPDRPLQR